MVFIVIPAYNEEKNIGRVISGLFNHGFKNIVVVDDGSADQTFQAATAAGVYALKHKINRGQGAALQTGDEFAISRGAEAVVHFDADGQFDPADISPALETMNKNNVDVIFGSRFLDGRSQMPWSKKYIIFPVARAINKIFTGVKLSDVHNGFRVLSRKALEKIKITQDRMAHNSEIVKQIKKAGLTFREFPVRVTYHGYGQGPAGGVKILWDLFKARLLK
ncbi:MAG: glycosyltransferase family 2 protein [Patescibacteria group bacterium]